ncbi:MAG TPA: FHA domain-containing protein [Pseudomonadales bacterium]|nr:FHA domain-containing protein [Pseudomonadales bacterium]
MLKLRFANKEHGDVWLVEPSVLVGSDTACQVVLKQDGISSRHLDIQIKGDQLTLVNLVGDKAVTINGRPVDKQADLGIGDTVMLAGIKLLIVDPKSESKPVISTQGATGWAIRPNHSALANKIYSIDGKTVVGRSNECDLSFSVTHLSRKHAELFILNGQLMVKDLESANGTYVNGARIEEAKLQKGDELRLDTLTFTVIGPGGESDRTTVRSAVSIPALKTEAPVTPVKPVQSSAPAEREKKRVAGTTTFQKAVSVSEDARQEVQKSKGNWVVVLVAFIAVAAILGYMLTLMG